MKLKEWRTNKGLNQEAMAVLLNQYSKRRKITQENISQWEGAGIMPRKPELLLISKVTKKKVTALDFLA